MTLTANHAAAALEELAQIRPDLARSIRAYVGSLRGEAMDRRRENNQLKAELTVANRDLETAQKCADVNHDSAEAALLVLLGSQAATPRPRRAS